MYCFCFVLFHPPGSCDYHQVALDGDYHALDGDYCHLMLLLAFILSSLFHEEVDEHNLHHCRAPVVDPSEGLIGVTSVFLRWYKRFRQTTPGKTPRDIGKLSSLYIWLFLLNSLHVLCILCILYLLFSFFASFKPPTGREQARHVRRGIRYGNYINYVYCSLLDLFRTVFPYHNGLNRLFMDTEKVHFIKHCHVDVTNYANLINCSCDAPEGGHKA